MSAEAVTAEEKTAARRGKPTAQASLRVVSGVRTDPSRDALLTDFGKKTLDDRYVLPGESYQQMFARVATAYADDAEHAQEPALLDMGSNIVLDINLDTVVTPVEGRGCVHFEPVGQHTA